MSTRYDCAAPGGAPSEGSDAAAPTGADGVSPPPASRADGLRHARDAIARGQLVVLPTDTVYGVAADAFTPDAVTALLAAKGRGRAMPPPVLMADLRTLDGLARDVSAEARALAEAFWPGALTLVVLSQPTLRWDLGDTGGTAALRVPDHPLALELLAATGPLAVSSANRTGEPAPTGADAAEEQLGAAVAVYLDDGPSGGAAPSTIVDATGAVPRVLRNGAIALELLREVVPGVLDEHGHGPESAVDPESAAGADGPDDARDDGGPAA